MPKQMDRILWTSLHAIAHGVGTTLGATFDGAQQVGAYGS